MTQGLNLKGTIWRMNQAEDDSGGGAVLTGTPVANSLPMALSSRRPSQASLEQGLEVEAIFDATVRCGVTIYERDEVEVTRPTHSPHYGLRFRVTGVQPARRTRASEQHLTLSRIRQSRREQ
jgi:hypothetical protein